VNAVRLLPTASGQSQPAQLEPAVALGPTPIDAYSNLYLGIDILLHSKKQHYKEGLQGATNPRATTSLLAGSQPYKDDEIEPHLAG